MHNSSVFSALTQIRALLTREEKIKWLWIAGFAMCTSTLELLTAGVIVIFAQVLNQPESGQHYAQMLGLGDEISPSRIVFYMAVLCGVAYFVKNCMAAAEVFYQNFTIQKMCYHFKNILLSRYAKVDYDFYLTRNSSLGLQVIGSDVEGMFTNGMLSMAAILSEGIVFICLLSLVVYMNPSLAIVIFGLAVVAGAVIVKFLLPQFYRFGKLLQETSLDSNQTLMQFFHGFKEIVLLGKTEAFIQAYQFYFLRKARVVALQKSVDSMPRMIIEVLFVGLFVVSIAVLCLDNESPAQMMGILSGYLYAGFRLMPGLNRIINYLNLFKASIPLIERVHSEYNLVTEKECYANVPGFIFNNNIRFENVSFHYLQSDNNTLTDLTLEIKKGESIGIVGETGSGKSTFIDLLLGLLRPTQGFILVDGQYPVNTKQWHAKIGYVPQSIYLTDDTIEANIAFGIAIDIIDAALLRQVIKESQLEHFIQRLPDGVKTLVGERGVRLSGGERQRIAIARALYRNPEVLIFDEATSALDTETEARLMDTIKEVSKDRTVIMVAHRLSTLEACDRIIKISKDLTVTSEKNSI